MWRIASQSRSTVASPFAWSLAEATRSFNVGLLRQELAATLSGLAFPGTRVDASATPPIEINEADNTSAAAVILNTNSYPQLRSCLFPQSQILLDANHSDTSSSY